uniref:Guanylate cyclase domain-containing protein n=1 Tax=Hemiselmis tepida TaxID=464990 RepID=A0A7S0V2S8_9CRYP|mmetsp:Transcript_10382/g.26931  ORF Transcript_10382/g.26931 Transcript_10382/m.26931 type:complete len:849 (+) Transcript_10382:359-2905(+)|eukprot:CAMPEP_0174942482 /NCGR_PEP_ID=MMETSP1355-20121228/74400_1 /TAXON_ID=464990 /ORGANISM="Hemiselmis tepida, Strain CCMP443" /LENGTH=848 /DNA_ID=CAMNT_0016189657 /DNA_START=321 /DNA_END=2867 /DNA_ORIENTATION=-
MVNGDIAETPGPVEPNVGQLRFPSRTTINPAHRSPRFGESAEPAMSAPPIECMAVGSGETDQSAALSLNVSFREGDTRYYAQQEIHERSNSGSTMGLTTASTTGAEQNRGIWGKLLDWRSGFPSFDAAEEEVQTDQGMGNEITDTAMYVSQSAHDFPMLVFYAFLIFCALAFSSIFVILEFARRSEAENRAAGGLVAKDLSIFFAEQFGKAFFYARAMASFATQIPHFQRLALQVDSWEKFDSPTGTPLRRVPPEALNLTESFNNIADSLYSQDQGLQTGSINNVQFAPAGVVTYIHPIQGNEGALGHDLLRDPNRRAGSIAAINVTDMWMIGPLNTIQGNLLVIGRLPIFIDAALGGLPLQDADQFPELGGEELVPGKNFWGFATVLFTWDILVNQSKISDVEASGYLINVTKSDRDENGTKTDKVTSFLSSRGGTIYDGITEEVQTGAGPSWDVTVQPVGGYRPEWVLSLSVVAGLLSSCVAGVCWIAMVANAQRKKLIDSMLPKRASRFLLRSPGKPFVEGFQNVVIFFSDIIGYTSMAGDLSPIDVMRMLNEVYTEFDRVASEHGVYKVETIGDSYMVVAGAPDRLEETEAAARVARFGLDLLDLISRFQSSQGLTLQVRCGMSSGPVVAGIVGTRMPRYCFFGDTVNMSSRMESTGVSGKLQTDSATVRLLERSDYAFRITQRTRSRGMHIKGKGRVHTFFVEECVGIAGEPPLEFGGSPLHTTVKMNSREEDDPEQRKAKDSEPQMGSSRAGMWMKETPSMDLPAKGEMESAGPNGNAGGVSLTEMPVEASADALGVGVGIGLTRSASEPGPTHAYADSDRESAADDDGNDSCNEGSQRRVI